MEQQKGKPMSKILKFLPRATSSVNFQNPSVYSPAKDKKPSEKPHKSNLGIGLSGPMVSLVSSPETRRKIKNDSSFTLVYEPTSPRVSCMGQVKCKHYQKLAAAAAAAAKAANANANKPANKYSRTTSFTPVVTTYIKNEEVEKKATKGKKKSGIRGLFRGGAGGSRKECAAGGKKTTTAAVALQKAPSLGKAKRFSSGRDAFANFDWTTQVTPLDCGNRSYYTDDDGGSDGEEVVMPSSAPVMERNKGVCDQFVRVGGVSLEPRKEINLWKRRTMAQPRPLQLHVVD